MKTRILLVSAILICMSCKQQDNLEKESSSDSKAQLMRSTLSKTFDAVDFPKGFDYPRDSKYLFQITQDVNVKAQREHGWHLFAGATQPSIPGDPESLPIFQTWFGEDETFAKEDTESLNKIRTFTIKMSPPTQLLLSDDNPLRNALKTTGIIPEDRWDPDLNQVSTVNGKSLQSAHNGPAATFSHVLFNKTMHNFIRDNKYYSKKQLNTLIDPAVVRKSIKPTPPGSISMKISWWPIAKEGLTALPVWDFDPRFPGDAKNPPNDWKRIVVVDPTGKNDAPPSFDFNKRTFNNPKKVGLENFYYEQLTDEEAQAANANWRLLAAANTVLGRALQGGDYIVMVAMHINTVEFSPWVFTSFWWHDKPNESEWAEFRTNDVKGKWANYLMGVSYNINTPREPNGNADIIYNPYLELFQAGGTRTSCMSCHARAAYSPTMRASYNPKITGTTDPKGFIPIPDGANDPAFKTGTLNLNTIWTIQTRSNNDE